MLFGGEIQAMFRAPNRPNILAAGAPSEPGGSSPTGRKIPAGFTDDSHVLIADVQHKRQPYS
jgi:hypothetical protein